MTRAGRDIGYPVGSVSHTFSQEELPKAQPQHSSDNPSHLPQPDQTPTPADVPAPQRAAVTFIFLTVALDMLALGMIAPVLPHLVESFVGGSTARTAEVIGLFGTVFATMQFFFSPVLGSLSDRFGRRPIVLLSNFGLGLDYVLMALAPSLGFLFVGRILSGITASSVPTAQAYMSDITPRERRAAAFGMLQAAFGFGFIIGPALGGLLASYHPRLPFWVSAALSLLNATYGYFVLPESLALEHRSPFSWKRANPVGSVHMLSRTRTLLMLAIVLLLSYTAQNSLLNVYVLYTDYRYHWSTQAVGLSLAALGIITVLYGVFLVRRASKLIGDTRALRFGLLGGSIGYFIFAIAHTGAVFLAGMPLLNLVSIAWPASQSIMSRSAAANEQGQLQGAINSMRGAAGIVGPSLFTWIFARAVSDWSGWHLPGLPFFAACVMMLGAVAISFATPPATDSQNS